jgi:hypothetical protein
MIDYDCLIVFFFDKNGGGNSLELRVLQQIGVGNSNTQKTMTVIKTVYKSCIFKASAPGYKISTDARDDKSVVAPFVPENFSIFGISQSP